jgi:hypothetical protein
MYRISSDCQVISRIFHVGLTKISAPRSKALVSEGALPKSTTQADDHARLPPAPARPATARRRSAIPRITDAIISEGLYRLVRAAGHAETRAWHVLVGGSLAGLVRPTWRGERRTAAR